MSKKKFIIKLIIKLFVIITIVSVSAIFLDLKFDVNHGKEFLMEGRKEIFQEDSRLSEFVYLGLNQQKEFQIDSRFESSNEDVNDEIPVDDDIVKRCKHCDAILSDDEIVDCSVVVDYVELRNVRSATCTSSGYTGDKYCVACGHLIEKGNSTPATGHNHTEIRNVKVATCTIAGYTGDTYCTDCGAKIKSGSTIAATGHLHTELRNMLEATEASEGYTGDTYCIDCGAKISSGNSIPKIVPEKTELDLIIDDIEAVEALSKSFSSSSYIHRAVIYIRSEKYKGSKWEFVGGYMDSNFPTYVKNNQGNHDLTYLRKKASIVDPVTNQKIDFLHMFATLSAIFEGSIEAELGGWAGDLCQLTAEIAGKTTTQMELEALVASKFNKKGSTFGPDDLLSDVDAANIYEVYKKTGRKSIAEAMRIYYSNLTESSRVEQFNAYLFGSANANSYSHSEKCDKIYSKICKNSYIVLYCKSVNIAVHSGQKNENELKACIKAFVDYLEQI